MADGRHLENQKSHAPGYFVQIWQLIDLNVVAHVLDVYHLDAISFFTTTELK